MRWKLAAAATTGAAVGVYVRWLGPRQRRWGATDDEVVMPLPGDELLDEPASQVTRAISIDASPGEVWPWIVQLGADKGGFYTYDWLENLFGLGIHSAESIVDGWQRLAVGDVVHADRARTGGWIVMDVRPEEAIVLQVADLTTMEPLRRDADLRWEFQWTFALRADPDGGTRLLIRERVAFGSAVTRTLMAPVGLVSFVMTRGTLRGVKARAEARHRATDTRRAV